MSARSSIIVDIESGVPLARLVPLTAAVGESETAFWRRMALERSLRIQNLQHVIGNLRDTIAVMEEEADS